MVWVFCAKEEKANNKEQLANKRIYNKNFLLHNFCSGLILKKYSMRL
jgi:hypothetical protein